MDSLKVMRLTYTGSHRDICHG